MSECTYTLPMNGELLLTNFQTLNALLYWVYQIVSEFLDIQISIFTPREQNKFKLIRVLDKLLLQSVFHWILASLLILLNWFWHIISAVKLRLFFDAWFEAQNEFAPANLHHKVEVVVMLHTLHTRGKYVLVQTHWPLRIKHQNLVIIFV